MCIRRLNLISGAHSAPLQHKHYFKYVLALAVYRLPKNVLFVYDEAVSIINLQRGISDGYKDRYIGQVFHRKYR